MAGLLSPSASPDTHFLFEERYQQLERNFNAVVQELQARPEGQPLQLQALLKRMEAELRHQVLRAQGAGSGTAQRLVEREYADLRFEPPPPSACWFTSSALALTLTLTLTLTRSILQRNFEAVVALMDGHDAPATSPLAGPAGGTPTTPAARAASPFTQHPWQPSSSYEPAVTPESSNHVRNAHSASPLPADSPALQAAAEREASLRQQLQQTEATAAAAAAATGEQSASLRKELQQARPPRIPPPLTPTPHTNPPSAPARRACRILPRLPRCPPPSFGHTALPPPPVRTPHASRPHVPTLRRASRPRWPAPRLRLRNPSRASNS